MKTKDPPHEKTERNSAVRSEYNAGVTIAELAVRYAVSRGRIQQITRSTSRALSKKEAAQSAPPNATYIMTEHGYRVENDEAAQSELPIQLSIDADGVPYSLKWGRRELLHSTKTAVLDGNELTIVLRVSRNPIMFLGRSYQRKRNPPVTP